MKRYNINFNTEYTELGKEKNKTNVPMYKPGINCTIVAETLRDCVNYLCDSWKYIVEKYSTEEETIVEVKHITVYEEVEINEHTCVCKN